MTVDKTKVAVTTQMDLTPSNSLVNVPNVPDTETPPKKRRFKAILLVLAGLVIIAFVWMLFGGRGATPVAVETVAAGPIERILVVSGRTETDVESDIKSKIAARVTEIKVQEGDHVAKGDTLVLLDASEQNSRVRQALAAMDAAILKQEGAQANRDRAQSLSGTISAVDLENAERELALAAAEVTRLRAALEQAQLALPDYQITAPISGIVLSRSIELGDLVSPSDLLMRLADTTVLHVEVQIDEIYADKIKVGQRAWLQLSGRKETLMGAVSFIAADVDELTGSLRVKLSFDEVPDTQIGLTTTVNILIDEAPSAITVPRSAFVANGSGTAVFVLQDERASLNPITFVDWPADRVEVSSGLTEGDQVLLFPEGIEDGQTIEVQAAPAEGD